MKEFVGCLGSTHHLARKLQGCAIISISLPRAAHNLNLQSIYKAAQDRHGDPHHMIS